MLTKPDFLFFYVEPFAFQVAFGLCKIILNYTVAIRQGVQLVKAPVVTVNNFFIFFATGLTRMHPTTIRKHFFICKDIPVPDVPVCTEFSSMLICMTISKMTIRHVVEDVVTQTKPKVTLHGCSMMAHHRHEQTLQHDEHEDEHPWISAFGISTI